MEGNWLDTVHFPEIAKRYPFRGKGIYKIYGRVIIEYNCVTIEAEFMEKCGIIEDPRYSDIRAGEGIFQRKKSKDIPLEKVDLQLPKGNRRH
jgi:hypothetical protein